MNFTEEQQLAIDTKNSNIIVSAGAGSGKTAVLTARVLRIIKEGTHVNELLVLTFTNAAAAEMKELKTEIKTVVETNKALLNRISDLTSDVMRLEREVRNKDEQ